MDKKKKFFFASLLTGNQDIADHPKGGHDAQRTASVRCRLEFADVSPHQGNAATNTTKWGDRAVVRGLLAIFFFFFFFFEGLYFQELLFFSRKLYLKKLRERQFKVLIRRDSSKPEILLNKSLQLDVDPQRDDDASPMSTYRWDLLECWFQLFSTSQIQFRTFLKKI